MKDFTEEYDTVLYFLSIYI